MGQAGDTRGPWWHRVTLVYAALVVAAPLLPPQVNRLQLQSPWGSARSQPGAPLHPFGASTSMCPGPSCSFRALLLLPRALHAELWLGSGIECGQQSCPARHDWLARLKPFLCISFAWHF